MDSLPAYRATLLPAWIDYNGHLRDAYYALVMSLAIDDVMDHLGLDAAYRAATACTLYTLELHLHFSSEVKLHDELTIATSVLDADRKRIHAGCRFICAGAEGAAATGEVMLLHVRQGHPPSAAPFPTVVEERLSGLRADPDSRAAWAPSSRKIQLDVR